MVDSHGGITLAALRDVTLSKRCVALPRYIVYVYRSGKCRQTQHQRIIEEHGSFNPVVFESSGSIGKDSDDFCKRLLPISGRPKLRLMPISGSGVDVHVIPECLLFCSV